MGQITVTKPGGTTIKLGTASPVVAITRAEQIWSLMEDDKVEIDVESSYVLGVGVKDYITVYGRKYVMNSPPEVEKTASNSYRYRYVFEGAQFDLSKIQFTLSRASFTATTDFVLMGTLSDFMTCMAASALRLSVTLNYAAPVTEVRNLAFSAENCLEILNRLADEYGLEWVITTSGSTYTITYSAKVGTDLHTTDIFSLGRGLRSLKRNNVTSKPYCTRLYSMGSDKNIPSNYRSYSGRLLPTGALNYIENATAKAAYGLIESTKIFDEVFPTRTGTITSLGGDEKTFIDSGMDFDLNATSGGDTLYLIPDNTPKIHFQSGKLAGYEFALKSYTHSTKTFVLASVTDERGLVLPNPTDTEFSFGIGDTYKILDIWLPASYVTAAEASLLTKATDFLTANCNPVVQYDVEMDEHWISLNKHGRSDDALYSLGDIININDASLGINSNIRILGIRRDVLRPYKYSFSLGESQYRKQGYRISTGLKGAIKNIGLAAIDDPPSIRLKLWGDKYAISQAAAAD